MRASKMVHCVDCNKEFLRKQLNRSRRCHDCAVKIVGENIGQLMAHEGPHYAKWRQSVIAAAEKL